MSISESRRRDIFVALESVHGPEVANDLMSILPHQPADQLVTREDLRVNMAELKTELRSEMVELKTELRTEMADLKITVQRYLTGAIAANTIAVVTALVT